MGRGAFQAGVIALLSLLAEEPALAAIVLRRGPARRPAASTTANQGRGRELRPRPSARGAPPTAPAAKPVPARPPTKRWSAAVASLLQPQGDRRRGRRSHRPRPRRGRVSCLTPPPSATEASAANNLRWMSEAPEARPERPPVGAVGPGRGRLPLPGPGRRRSSASGSAPASTGSAREAIQARQHRPSALGDEAWALRCSFLPDVRLDRRGKGRRARLPRRSTCATAAVL